MIIQIDRTKDRFLGDHTVGGVPILPTVMGLDLLVRATALKFTRHTQLVVRDVVVGPPVLIKAEPRTLCIAAEAASNESWYCQLTSPDSDENHLRATVQIVADDRRGRASPAAAPIAPGIGPDLIYPPYFHGPTFHVVGKFHRTDQGFLASMAELLPELRWSVGRSQVRPRLLELFMQGGGLIALVENGRLMIPSSIEKLTWYPDALIPAAGLPERPALAEIFPRRAANEVAAADTFDGRVVDSNGHLLLDVVGYHCVDLGLPADAEHAAALGRLLQQTEGASG